jgi:hypothetical protein
MQFMVIERFKGCDPEPIGARFKEKGRMLPDGLAYHASWVDAARARCFQIMETDRPELLDEWIGCWNDLIEFEVIPVTTSADYWAGIMKI